MAVDPPSMSLQGAVDLSALVKKHASPPPAPNAQSGLVRDVTESSMSDIVALSHTVPVILEFYGQGHQPALGPVVESFGGRLVLATIDVATSPELVRGLQITGIPTVFAIIQGRPAPLFQGIPPEDDIKRLFAEVLQVASQAGVTGLVDTAAPAETDSEAASEPAWLQAARTALAANDVDAARAAYQEGLQANSRDALALQGLARVELLTRIAASGKSAEEIRTEAATHPTDPSAQFLVADLDVSGGHLDDAFRRLLAFFSEADPDTKPLIRDHLVGLFDVAGTAHPAVISARQQLTSLLF